MSGYNNPDKWNNWKLSILDQHLHKCYAEVSLRMINKVQWDFLGMRRFSWKKTLAILKMLSVNSGGSFRWKQRWGDQLSQSHRTGLENLTLLILALAFWPGVIWNLFFAGQPWAQTVSILHLICSICKTVNVRARFLISRVKCCRHSRVSWEHPV